MFERLSPAKGSHPFRLAVFNVGRYSLSWRQSIATGWCFIDSAFFAMPEGLRRPVVI
jgi:hypothetical protein